jgi:hypothetical protein
VKFLISSKFKKQNQQKQFWKKKKVEKKK